MIYQLIESSQNYVGSNVISALQVFFQVEFRAFVAVLLSFLPASDLLICLPQRSYLPRDAKSSESIFARSFSKRRFCTAVEAYLAPLASIHVPV